MNQLNVALGTLVAEYYQVGGSSATVGSIHEHVEWFGISRLLTVPFNSYIWLVFYFYRGVRLTTPFSVLVACYHNGDTDR